MSRPYALIALIFFSLLLAACSKVKDELDIFKDDVDFASTERNVDVTRENMEAITLGILQSAYLSFFHVPVFNVLDASDFDAVSCLGSDPEKLSSKNVGELYSSADTVSITYDNCMQADGSVYDGKVSIDYGLIRGLNKSFMPIDSNTCLAIIRQERGASLDLVQNVDPDTGEYFIADALRFRQIRDGLELDWLREVEDAGDVTVGADYEVVETLSLPSEAIVSLRVLEVDETRSLPGDTKYKLKSGTRPSLDGDAFYYVSGVNFVFQECQQYDRSMAMRLQDLKAEISASESYMLSGNISILEGSNDVLASTQQVIASDFVVEHVSESLRSRFELKSFNMTRLLDASSGAFSYTVSGLISSPEIDGTIELSTRTDFIVAPGNSAPDRGNLVMQGDGFEVVNAGFSGTVIELTADTDGDTNGDGRSDPETAISTFWQDLLNRDFVAAP